MVITIIAILVALFLGVNGTIQNKARSVQCANNLRQIGIAVLQYTTDNNNFFPTTNPAWDVKVSAYLGISSTTSAAAILKCPNDPRSLNATSNFPRSYALSRIRDQSLADATHIAASPIDDGDGLTSPQVSRQRVMVTRPSQTILATEWFTDSNGALIANYQFQASFGGVTGWKGGPSANNWPRLQNGRAYHSDTMNFIFVDGHMAAMAPVNANTPDDLWTAVQ